MNYKNLIEIIDKYDNAEIVHIKNNLYDLLQERDLKPTMLANILNVSKHMAKNYINASNPYGKMPLKLLLHICYVFNVEVETLLKENNRTLGMSHGGVVKWDDEKQAEFLKDINNLSLKEIAEKYEINETSIAQRIRLIKQNKQY